jgi:hypothetical protein
MSEDEDISRKARGHFQLAATLSLEDTEAKKLIYHLKRLTSVGLTEEDVKDLVELGRLAFQESDVMEQTAKIKQRADTSPLAFAIADILQAGSGFPGRVSLKAVMFGTVLGAYTPAGAVPNMDKSTIAILGAIGGAVATSTSTFIADNINRLSWHEYLRMPDSS